MFGTGGSAIIAKKIGQNKESEANGDLSLIVITIVIISMAKMCIRDRY